MARMKKAEVIEALKLIPELQFDENGNYNDLCKLLKEQTAPPADETVEPEKKSKKHPGIYPENMPAKVKFESKTEAKYASINRSQQDQMNIDAKLREINRAYGATEPISISRQENNKAVSGVFVTNITIVLKED